MKILNYQNNMSRLKTKRPDEILVEYFYSLKNWDYEDKEFLKENKIVFGRHLKPARDLIELCAGDLDRAKNILERTKNWVDSFAADNEFLIETAIKKYLEYEK